ncbi:hypothetical protein [Pectobacterium brasiliense]|uniref:hypothetical protein n=1 Tax=Pectobacterium brasiliense TaxID=180957 RepID=UPI001CF1B5E2|nr:hypothetical protein [Pectobacterium brasiliense]MCH4994241.1 hypothetical protein [Pectobacterium brasiliense]
MAKIITALKKIYTNTFTQQSSWQRRRKTAWLPDKFHDGTVFFDESYGKYYIKNKELILPVSFKDQKEYLRQCNAGRIAIIKINIDGYYQSYYDTTDPDEIMRLRSFDARIKHNKPMVSKRKAQTKRTMHVRKKRIRISRAHCTRNSFNRRRFDGIIGPAVFNNPATGLPMFDSNIDIMGNPCGFDLTRHSGCGPHTQVGIHVDY